MKKRTLSLFLCVLMLIGLLVPVSAVDGHPEESTNYGDENYNRWAVPIHSYLFENIMGGLTRVAYANDHILVENYDSQFRYLAGRRLEMELPIWGGFHAGKKYNFIVVGQNNPNEDDSVEILRVIKYDKNWNRLDHASLYGVNTTKPFNAGSVRCSEYNGELFIRTCHEMYHASDGLNHQACATAAIREEDMSITDAWYGVMNLDYGYVSHSFNQYVIVDQEARLVCVDQGDAYPRAAVLIRYPFKADTGKFSADYKHPAEHVEIIHYAGEIGDNKTGASIGGLGETSTGYLIAHTYDGKGGGGFRIPYLSYISKDGLQVTNRVLPYASNDSACPPSLVATGPDTGYVLWDQANDAANDNMIHYIVNDDGSYTEYKPEVPHVDDTLFYTQYNADGSFGEVKTAPDAPLSDCHPILYYGNVVWYVTDHSGPTFYVLSDNGVTPHPATVAEEIVPARAGTAYESTQRVEIDGEVVEMMAYALKDPETGYPTNYVKLRDLADLINGTAANFDVDWDGAVNICTRSGYDPNGSEGWVPFSGDRAYKRYDGETLVDGVITTLGAITLTDDNGGDYTYYKLRDLGAALNFNVGWSAKRGIYLETDREYTEED